MHSWGSGHGTINEHPHHTLFAEELPPPAITPMFPHDMTRSLGFTHVPEPFLSYMDEQSSASMRRAWPSVPPSIAQQMRVSEFVGYAPNTMKWKLHQLQYPKSALKVRSPNKLKGAQVTPGYVDNCCGANCQLPARCECASPGVHY